MIADMAAEKNDKIEQLRKDYVIHEGDVIRMKIEVHASADDRKASKIAKVRIKEVHEHFVTVIRPDGFIESFQWWDFERRRVG